MQNTFLLLARKASISCLLFKMICPSTRILYEHLLMDFLQILWRTVRESMVSPVHVSLVSSTPIISSIERPLHLRRMYAYIFLHKCVKVNLKGLNSANAVICIIFSPRSCYNSHGNWDLHAGNVFTDRN